MKPIDLLERELSVHRIHSLRLKINMSYFLVTSDLNSYWFVKKYFPDVKGYSSSAMYAEANAWIQREWKPFGTPYAWPADTKIQAIWLLYEAD